MKLTFTFNLLCKITNFSKKWLRLYVDPSFINWLFFNRFHVGFEENFP